MSVRVRFAPSPTGYLHIGGLRTALFCYLYARAEGGTFILRIEDTDQKRYVPDAEEDFCNALEWVGLTVDEGPHLGAGYRQSERTDYYRQYARQLLDTGHAYYAFDTPEDLSEMRGRGEAYNGETRRRMCNSLTLSEEEVAQRKSRGEPYVVRMRVPDKVTVRFSDLIKGDLHFASGDLDDQVLIKADGFPTYHLANVVDDHLMRVSHVIRGEEWVSSTPKHILLYQALGWEPPQMAHLPLILSPTGGKLSKRSALRQGLPVFVKDYRSAGYEPEALINFLALLGWHPSTEQEVFSLGDLISSFTLERVSPSPAQFDVKKLQWFNQQHLSRLSSSEVCDRTMSIVHDAFGNQDRGYLTRVLEVIGDRLVMRTELASTYGYFFQTPDSYNPKGVKKRWKPDAGGLVEAYAEEIEMLEPFDAGSLESALRSLAARRGAGAGRIIHPVRLAVSGTFMGPSLFDMMVVLGRRACVSRLRRAVQVLGK